MTRPARWYDTCSHEGIIDGCSCLGCNIGRGVHHVARILGMVLIVLLFPLWGAFWLIGKMTKDGAR